jgi:hypothetical protein
MLELFKARSSPKSSALSPARDRTPSNLAGAAINPPHRKIEHYSECAKAPVSFSLVQPASDRSNKGVFDVVHAIAGDI